jgi:hypothetical protein
MKTKQPYYTINKFPIVKQINTLKKAIHKILSDSISSKDDEVGGNRDKSSDNEARGQNRAEDNSDSH